MSISNNTKDNLHNGDAHGKPENNQQAEQRFRDIMEKILPIVKYGTLSSRKVTIQGEEHEIPEQSLPVIFPIAFDTLSIVFGIDEGAQLTWLQNKDIEVAQGRLLLDDLLAKAYENLFRLVKDTISVTMINARAGMLTNCHALESSFFVTNEIWDHIRATLHTNDVIFAIPTQDIFIFCDAQSVEDITFIRGKINELFEDATVPKKISSKLYLKKESGETEIYT